MITDDLYVRNMAVLFRVDGRLAQRIDACADDDSVVVEPSRHGPATAAIRSPGSDRPVYLHSRVDPVGEAERFAASIDVEDTFCHVVGGFGLGHHIKALAARLKGSAFIVATEPSLPLLKAALGSVDLTEVFARRRCIVLTSNNKGDVQDSLEPHNTLMMLGTQFLPHPPSERVAGPFHSHLRKLIADHMTYCRMSLVTLVANSRITCRNIANNLPRFLSTPTVETLRDRFHGYPGIVVAAGPSLRRNIDRLAELKGRAVIIAVQTTYKTLLDRGIVPDFVTSLDYHEMSKRFFEGVQDFSGTHLVAEPKVTWHVLDAFTGPVSLLDNGFARLCLGDELAGRPGLKAGATVAHLAFYLALYMGCDPLVLVGQDLGYTGHTYYAPGTAMHDTWRPELNRFSTMEMKEWERIVRSRKILMRVQDIQGRDIYTDEQLFTYLQQFEGDFAALPGRVIDATEGGVRKTGTRTMSLAEVAETYCRQPIPAERFAYLRELNWNDPARLGAGRAELKQRLAEVDRLSQTCERLLLALNELIGLLEEPEKFNRRIRKVDELHQQVREMESTYRLISSVSQHAELQRFSADRHLGLSDAQGKDRARAQLERDIRFVKAVIEGAGALREILTGGLDRFDQALEAAPQGARVGT